MLVVGYSHASATLPPEKDLVPIIQVGSRAAVEGCGKFWSHRNSNPGSSSPQPVDIATELSRSTKCYNKFFLRKISQKNSANYKPCCRCTIFKHFCFSVELKLKDIQEKSIFNLYLHTKSAVVLETVDTHQNETTSTLPLLFVLSIFSFTADSLSSNA